MTVMGGLARDFGSSALLVLAVATSAEVASAQVDSWPPGMDGRSVVAITPSAVEGGGAEDFAIVARAIGDRRVVLLGEQGHGDGTTIRAKARLARYLMEKEGFDILLFESGLYDCERSWVDVENGRAFVEEAPGCLFRIWAESEQAAPLLAWIDSAAVADTAVRVGGIDIQPSGRNAPRMLEDLTAFLSLQQDTTGLRPAMSALQRAFAGAMRPAPTSGTGDPVAALTTAVEAVLSLDLHDVDTAGLLGEAAFWRRVLGGIPDFVAVSRELPRPEPRTEIMNLRDRGMGENLVWWAERFPEKRIIVWAATSHLVRDRTGIENDPVPEMIPAGQVAHTALEDEMYTIAFVGTGGTTGGVREGDIGPVPSPPPGSLDARWHSLGQPYGFVDLEALSRSNGWPARPFVTGAIGYRPMETRWERHIDAIFFIREQAPNRLRSGGPRP